MSEPSDLERLRALEARIARLKKTPEVQSNSVADAHAMGQHAWRMVTELVAGLVIGFGIGYGLDVLFGTMPLFLVLFILLGLVAGVRVMMRTAADVQKNTVEAAAQAAQNKED